MPGSMNCIDAGKCICDCLMCEADVHCYHHDQDCHLKCRLPRR